MRSKKNRLRPNQARVNMRVPKDLLKWAKSYAKRRGTSLTQCVISHLVRLREEARSNA